MRRRSRAGGEPAKAQAPKAAARKSRIASKAGHPRSTSTANLETEVARLARERDEALEQQTATSEVLSIIRRSPADAQPVFDAIVQSAARLCGAIFSAVYLYEDDHVHIAATNNFSPEAARRAVELREQKRPDRSHLGGRAILDRAIVHVPDVLNDPEYSREWALAGGWRAVLAVPLLRDGKPVGAVTVAKAEPKPFSDRQVQLLNSFADQALIAIENVRLFEAEQQRTRELTESLKQQMATSEVLQAISTSQGELQPVFDSMLANATRLCAAKFGTMFLCEGDDFRVVAQHNAPPELAVLRQREPIVRAGPGTAIRRSTKTKQAVQIADIAAEQGYSEREEQHVVVELGGYRAVLSVPMLKDDKVIGAINIYRQDAGAFLDKQIELVTNFAAQAVIAIENARLLNELRQRTTDLTEALEQQTATSEILRVISSSQSDLQRVFESLLENATRLCGAKFGNLFLRAEDGFRYMAMHGVPSEYAELGKRLPQLALAQHHPNVPLARMTREKRVVHVPDLTLDESYTEHDPRIVALVETAGARTIVVVPMLKDDELVGAIAIYRQEVRPFSDKQIALLNNFAAQAVIAVENARLLNELRESLEQQTATSDVLRVISSSPADIQPVLEIIGERAGKLCDAEISAVSIVDGELIHLASIHGHTEAEVEAMRRAFPIRRTDETVHARAIRSRSVCHVADVLSDPQYQLKDTARVSGYRGCLGVPMVRGEQAVGAIVVARREPGLFSEAQVQLLKTFADQAVIAIENVRLFKETKNSLEQQTATADVLKIISRSTFDLETVLQTLLESAARFCNADKASIIREKNGAFYAAEAYGFSDEFLEYMQNIPIKAERGSASGRALVEGRVVHIADVAADPEYTLVEGAKLGDYRTVLCVPMLREGIPIGLLVLTRSEVQPFTDEQIELVTTFADQAAIAIENVRLFEAEQERTQELAKSLENLQTTQDRLVQTQKLASLGQLTAGIAHEIKNPLNFVNNFSGVSAELVDELRETLDGVKVDEKTRTEITELTNTLRDNLDKIVQHGKRADAIVKNMLLHSREGSGEHRPVDANALVEESLNLAYHGARAEKQGFKINMERSFDPAAGQVDVFPQEITRALLNLISNGFYAATKRKEQDNGDGYEPTLVASTKNLGDRVEIRIRDNGTGIPPEVRDKMFNPFFTTKPAGEGTGLGLSITHDIIVKQHSGSIEVDTRPGEFTEVRVILPRTATFITDTRGRT